MVEVVHSVKKLKNTMKGVITLKNSMKRQVALVHFMKNAVEQHAIHQNLVMKNACDSNLFMVKLHLIYHMSRYFLALVRLEKKLSSLQKINKKLNNAHNRD